MNYIQKLKYNFNYYEMESDFFSALVLLEDYCRVL